MASPISQRGARVGEEWGRAGGPLMHMLKQNKETVVEPETGKNIPTQSNKR